LSEQRAYNALPEVKEKNRIKAREHNSMPEVKARNNQRQKNKKKNNPSFRLRKYVSDQIYRALKKQGSSKNGKSAGDYILDEVYMSSLFAHIEKQFSAPENLTQDGKVWMTWENHGRYNRDEWNDNDPNTWKWQIDHIIPQSEFPIDSLDHQNIMKCWALDNIRPLSAKQNVIDGCLKTRHTK